MSYASAVWLAALGEFDDESDSIPSSLDNFDDDFLLKHFHFTRSAVCSLLIMLEPKWSQPNLLRRAFY
uniref:Uncharacterized protein n=1 Tax=Anguilla anguilla TaxID=7936 RepID=A0A0E9PME0_ANGAN